MSDLTPKIVLLNALQGGKEATANANFNASSHAMLYGYDSERSTAGQFAWYGGEVFLDGVRISIPNGSVGIPTTGDRYIQTDRSGNVQANGATWDANSLPLWKVTTSNGTITVLEDHRDPRMLERFWFSHVVIAMADANKTLTAHQSLACSLEATGALSLLRDVIVPALRRQWTVFSNTTGGFGVRWKTPAGTGITVADGKRAILMCDGTNVVRVTPDT